MTSATGRHARREHAARKLILALALMAGIAIAAAAATAAIVSLATAPASVTVPGPQSHAPVRAHHAPVVVRPEARNRAQRVYVTVRPGECLSTIAAAHGIPWHALYRANRAAVGANPNVIYAGLRLRIPVRRANRHQQEGK